MPLLLAAFLDDKTLKKYEKSWPKMGPMKIAQKDWRNSIGHSGITVVWHC